MLICSLKLLLGARAIFVTTTTSLHEHSDRINFAALPKTFQDAITITRKLGYRFIWIDALCILQDSSSDREKESQKMGIVYSQAVVTIAASASTSVHGGCFNQQSVSHLSHMRYKLAVRTTTFDGDETERSSTKLMSQRKHHRLLRKVHLQNELGLSRKGFYHLVSYIIPQSKYSGNVDTISTPKSALNSTHNPFDDL
jgi:hypothetical protein